MPDAKFLTKDGAESRTVSLDGPLFESEPNGIILHEYVKGYLRNQRQGSSSTLNRARMKGGGRKPYRQKGTGRSRAGSNNSPLWTGGAIIFGPVPKDYYRRMPRRLKRKALVSALSLKAKSGDINIVEKPDVNEPKTRIVADYLKKLGLYHRKTILLYEGKDDNLSIASKNIRYFNVKRAELVNPYDLLWHKTVLITEDGLARIKEIFGDG
ncbi:MAG: 50S ribosomal protein L4 [Candidatus Zixiibacteriota bacterium]|nr:MAG: 50S ribosomal protein L4 [candidate division Zixibacteria bacterium]